MPQLSDPVAMPVFAGKEDAPHSIVTLPGHIIIGGWLSVTVTVKLHVTEPQLFVAVIVTVVVPLLNTVPLPIPLPLAVVAPLKV